MNQWPIFSILDPAFFQQVKLASVYGQSGNEALVITKEDQVYSLGCNVNGCLGVGDCTSTLLPRKVPQLCEAGMPACDVILLLKSLTDCLPTYSTCLFFAGISDLAYGSGPHVVVVTGDGRLFSWGHNGYGQLGQGLAVTNGHISLPIKIEGPLDGVPVAKVACGGHHTLALSREGNVRLYI